ncbi:uncharacterized protein TRUGW13939_05161 [Talaromyces rugulosus]|uniref:Uncharacterized protein n=1 Tax=Talaromyces rugulosus TaxID=121627 RepID=A0A7H8QX71_TALRU|nr:uncharacterized protein TRUGW13939_05161 [Talaromyces rugulosus]QKX58041.1 hypothetical protein TRUGW13939_05161 [Talaromyces rugulosus]
MAHSTLSHDDYTVAWICALPIEMAAAKVMLDEIHHDRIENQPPTDHNTYTLGKLHGHDVVIAGLPLGIYGTTSATAVLTQMRPTFPSLRFALMVGIGGGVPGKADVRLGDVVVSKPTASGSGVIQYDYGKTMRNGCFLPTGFLDKPPRFLLTAMTKIESNHMMGERPIKQIIVDVLEKKKDMRDKFSRPSDDWLFSATYPHQNDDHDCSTCDLNQLIDRPGRATNEPYIHYGLIASGNQVMKDAQTRDQIAQDPIILCFEMEAAGLMDQIGCLVIRGICDYCDSHKQKQWQGYASLAAAAYAKLLLSVVGTEFSSEENACLGSLSKINPIEYRNKPKWIKYRAQGTFEWIIETPELRTWLGSQEVSTEVHSNILWLYGYPGTGKSTMAITIIEKVLNHPLFVNRDATLSYFFCNSSSQEYRTSIAILGGLLYQIAEQLPQSMKHLLPIFQERKENPFDSFDILWNILIDISRVNATCQFYCVIDALDECDQESQKTLLTQIKQTFANDNNSMNIHFLITSRPHPEIRDYLCWFKSKELSTYQEVGNDLRILIRQKVNELSQTKQYPENVKRKVSEILQEKAEGTFLWVGIVCDDLTSESARNAITKLQSLPRGLDSLYSRLLETALAKAEKEKHNLILQILSVVTVSRRPLNVAELSIACGLCENEGGENLLISLEVIDMCHLMIVVKDDIVRLLHKSMKDFLLRVQGGNLINLSRENATLAYRCINYFLSNAQSINGMQNGKVNCGFLEYAVLYWPEHASAAQAEFDVQPAHTHFFQLVSKEREQWLEAYNSELKFSSTPKEFSVIHVAAAWNIPNLIDFSMVNISTIQKLKMLFWAYPGTGWYTRPWKGRHLHKALLNAQDGTGKSPLHWAIIKSHTHIIDVFLQQGADVDLRDNESKCALHFAAEIGDERLVQILLRSPKNLEAKDNQGRTPLLIAVDNLQFEVIHRLVNAGAQVNALNNMNQNALHLICIKRQSSDSCNLLRYFIGHGISACECDIENMTPFLYAIGNGSEDLAAFLLENGVDVNFQIHRKSWVGRTQNVFLYDEMDNDCEEISEGEQGSGLSALHFSALKGDVRMTEFLLHHRADPNTKSDAGDTPLHLAIRKELIGIKYQDPWVTDEYAVEMLRDIYEPDSDEATEINQQIDQARIDVVRVLLESSTVDVNIVNNRGDYPLHLIPYITKYGDIILEMLIYNKAIVSQLNHKNQTCLHLASRAGNLKAIERLIRREECDFTLLDANGLSPLHHAVICDEPHIVRFMLDRFQDKEREFWKQLDHLGKNILHHHVQSLLCSRKMIDLLLEYGFPINDLDAEGDSILSLYLSSPHLSVQADTFQYILRKTSTECIKRVDRKGRNLIHLSMRQRRVSNVTILEDLLKSGIDINAKDVEGRGIMHHGAIHGAFNKALTQFLQARPIFKLHERDLHGKTPLEYAEEEANRERDGVDEDEIQWKQSLQNLRHAELFEIDHS